MIRNAIRFALASLLVTTLMACATSGGSADRATAKRPQDSHNIVDEAQVARVEALARQRGMLVQWVHKPQKRVSTGG